VGEGNNKSKGFGGLGKAFGCVLVVDKRDICFRLPWYDKENERFGKGV